MNYYIKFPDRKVGGRKDKIEEVFSDRRELNHIGKFIYQDRSGIKLAHYRPTEKNAFLRTRITCTSCKRVKTIRSFYLEESDTLLNKCKRCKQHEEIYDILRGIV